MTSALRLAVAAVIVVLLARSARVAWHNRHLAVRVWRQIRPRHVGGSLLLMVVVLGVAFGLMTLVPVTGYGLGSFLGVTGNAVFAPVEEAAARTATVAGPSAVWWSRLLTAATVLFLAGLLTMFPWLAYVEERVFREGLERAGTLRRGWTALRFGLTHLIMLVPVAAALAIAVAGLWYGHVYVRAYAGAAARPVPEPALAAVGGEGPAPVGGVVPDTRAAQDEAVLASTVWHTTFNSLIVILLLGGIFTGWL